MSRMAKKPIEVPGSVKLTLDNLDSRVRVVVEGSIGKGELLVHPLVEVTSDTGSLLVRPRESSKESRAQAGTFRSLLQNLVTGVSQGFSKTLQLVGVGYRAQVKGDTINLSLGFSHPVEFNLPKGVSAETPSQTEILLKAVDKQLLGQTAANIRAYRRPEPYKGKGIRYSDEIVKRKEAKKK